MGVSKVEFGNDTLIDLTGDTVNANNLLAGATAHGADGEPINGNVIVHDVIDNLSSDSAEDALSANQGRILNEKIITVKEVPDPIVGGMYIQWIAEDTETFKEGHIYKATGIPLYPYAWTDNGTNVLYSDKIPPALYEYVSEDPFNNHNLHMVNYSDARPQYMSIRAEGYTFMKRDPSKDAGNSPDVWTDITPEGDSIVEITYEAYQELTEEEKNDGTTRLVTGYPIEGGGSSGGSGISVLELSHTSYDNLPIEQKKDTSKLYMVGGVEDVPNELPTEIDKENVWGSWSSKDTCPVLSDGAIEYSQNDSVSNWTNSQLIAIKKNLSNVDNLKIILTDVDLHNYCNFVVIISDSISYQEGGGSDWHLNQVRQYRTDNDLAANEFQINVDVSGYAGNKYIYLGLLSGTQEIPNYGYRNDLNGYGSCKVVGIYYEKKAEGTKIYFNNVMYANANSSGIKTKTYTGNGSTTNTITFDETPAVILGWCGNGEGYTMSFSPFTWLETKPCGLYNASGISSASLQVTASYDGNSITLTAPNAPSAFNGNGGNYTIVYM